MAEKKTKPQFKQAEVEKVVLDIEDITMKLVAYKGIMNYDCPEAIKNWGSLKNFISYGVENCINNENVVQASPAKEYVRLNVTNNKKYQF